ncbi:hypothetical protein JYB87_09225 [Shewanella avicenniae]|uniref:N-acetyltransferase domain-containing protein n=1 Tax=Shewanella avicenniae TaxID=2814294 RepID=A0ABX7QXH4_9GAMM|nr:hypothetical protein [Shewanella avicenniae]QSX35346.1 hypothetical protein JYB87_09225 [Shewanella avicenniae]
MRELDSERFCEDLNVYLKTQFKYKHRVAHKSPLNQTITAFKFKFDLYFRWLVTSREWKPKTFVVARIHFKKTRCGNGTRLLAFLCEQAKIYDYENIGIESANANSSAFAHRLGFEPMEDKCWTISVRRLTEILGSDEMLATKIIPR